MVRWLRICLPLLLAGSVLAASVLPSRRPTANLREGLVAFWRLNEASDVRYDSGPNGLDLSDIGTVGSGTGNTYTTAADFEQSNGEYLVRSDTPLLEFTTSMTVAAWVNLETADGVADEIAAKSDYSVSTDREWELYRSATFNRFIFAVFHSGGSGSVTANTHGAPSTGAWLFIVAKYDGATLSIRVNDGVADTTAYAQTLQNGSGSFTIGAILSPAANYFDGLMGPVMVWDRALNRQEERLLYNLGLGVRIEQF